jgi:HEAT repeat protein
MNYGISSQRSGVIRAIENSKSAEAYYLIEEAMQKDIDPDVRGNAVFSLINLKIKDEKLWLSALSSESNSDVLRKIVFAIDEFDIEKAGPALFVLLTNNLDNEKANDLSSGIIRTIGKIGYRPAAPEILNILTNILYGNEVRSSAAISIGDIGDISNISILSNLLENDGESNDIRMFCAYSIGKSGNIQAINILMPHVENEKEDLNIRLYSIEGLSYVKNRAVFEKMVEFTKSDNTRIRLEAVRALSHSPYNKEAEDLLKYKAVYDPDFNVQKEAKKTLSTMGIELDKNISLTNKDTKAFPTPLKVTNK